MTERQICTCRYCAAGLPARCCIATRELSPAETARVEEILARHQSDGSEVSAARGSEDAMEHPESNPGHGGTTTRAADEGETRG